MKNLTTLIAIFFLSAVAGNAQTKSEGYYHILEIKAVVNQDGTTHWETFSINKKGPVDSLRVYANSIMSKNNYRSTSMEALTEFSKQGWELINVVTVTPINQKIYPKDYIFYYLRKYVPL